MGRYSDQPSGDFGISHLDSNINKYGDVLLQQQINSQNQKQKMKQIIQAALLKNMALKPGADPNRIMQDSGDVDFSQLMNAPKEKPSTTRISISQRPFGEVLKARDELARSPQDWLKAGMATEGAMQPGTGLFGTNFLGKKDIKLNPEAESIVNQAKTILANPNRISKSVSSQSPGGSGIDINTDDSSDNTLPDASGYEEGTLVEDGDGNKFKSVNGQWVAQ